MESIFPFAISPANEIQEQERAAEEQEKREVDIARGNPLLNPQDFSMKRRWDDDVVFKNQARGTENKGKKEFVNVGSHVLSSQQQTHAKTITGLATLRLSQTIYGKNINYSHVRQKVRARFYGVVRAS